MMKKKWGEDSLGDDVHQVAKLTDTSLFPYFGRHETLQFASLTKRKMHFHAIAALFVGIGIGLFGIGRALKAGPHKYDFFPNSHVMPDEYKYYDGEFTKSMYDTAITYDSEHIRKVVHIGTSNGVAVLYLGIGLQLSGHGSLVSSFDYHAANENPI